LKAGTSDEEICADFPSVKNGDLFGVIVPWGQGIGVAQLWLVYQPNAESAERKPIVERIKRN
jgi:hypothetical protein